MDDGGLILEVWKEPLIVRTQVGGWSSPQVYAGKLTDYVRRSPNYVKVSAVIVHSPELHMIALPCWLRVT